MSEEGGKSVWEVLWDQATDPWDYVCLGVGAVAGGTACILLGGTDVGTCAALGATAALTLSKATLRAFLPRRLRRRAKNLVTRANEANLPAEVCENFVRRVKRSCDEWQDEHHSAEKQSEILNEYVNELRQLDDKYNLATREQAAQARRDEEAKKKAEEAKKKAEEAKKKAQEEIAAFNEKNVDQLRKMRPAKYRRLPKTSVSNRPTDKTPPKSTDEP